MATHAELVELFGPAGVATVGPEALAEQRIPQADAEVLSSTGLPTFLDVLFTTETKGEPQAFTVVPVEAGDEQVRVLALGAPTDADDMRYCLDLEHGYVILLTLSPEPAAEIVNRTLDDFVEFLYRLALYSKHVERLGEAEAQAYTAQLGDYLRARDQFAFASPESWWSMVLDQLG
ncbi:SUKH-4 family immunity protein [Kitasatospora sp. NPDC050543]|uniref:SUKH-4 family immunity protein n=1 Tax=Kitasatospora sp. NPDC050543 TaxID=3364054 RepID=UPI0037A121F5